MNSQECSIIEKYQQSKRGDRGNFIRIGVTMEPEMIKRLKIVSARLQELGYSDTDTSSLIRCACKELLFQIEDFMSKKNENK